MWENRQARRGRRLTLNVIVLPARNPALRQPDPIFLLTGGPGLGVATEAWTAQWVDAARDARDVVLVDQRGTGASAPLHCDMYGHGLAPFLGDRFPLARVRACRTMLEQRADLGRYTTPDAADDLDDVRAALGYDRIDLVGLSYGSKAALVYLRRHGEHVRSVVLDGVITTAYPTPLPAAVAGDRALRRVFADCAADGACHRAFPDVAADFRAAVARLDRAPARVTLVSKLGLAREQATLTRRTFVTGVWEMLYSAGTSRDIPRLVHAAAAGDFDPVAQTIAEHRQASWPRNDAGTLFSIICSEDTPSYTEADVARAASASLVGAPLSREALATCALWPHVALPAAYREPVRSSVPVLLVSGAPDPIAPPEWAERAARTLPNSRRLLEPNAGHVNDDDCALAIIAGFLARPEPETLDLSCEAGRKRPAFRVK